jgi:hypothetical protein
MCSGTPPTGASQSCTPSSPSCGPKVTSQTVADTSTCSYSWTAGGFGACSADGSWSYVWTPTTGCGDVTQTVASATCSAGTGTQTQTVSCKRSDGTSVASSFCTGAPPAASQSCTGSQAPTVGSCVPDPANQQYCVVVPLTNQ